MTGTLIIKNYGNHCKEKIQAGVPQEKEQQKIISTPGIFMFITRKIKMVIIQILELQFEWMEKMIS